MASTTIVAARDARLSARITAAWPLPGVRAGSALVRVGDRLLAVQDDAFAAVWIDPATRRTEVLTLRGSGAPLAKADKPDFESAFAHADRIWVLGSGSRPSRCCLARIDLAQREAPLFNVAPLFGALAAALGHAPNIEGAVPLADRLRLFHRGAGGSRGASYTIDVPLEALSGATPRVLALTRYELGTLGPIGLSFTDAVAVDARRILFLAVAEDTPDGIADGPVTGATLGLIEGGQARLGPLLEAGGGACRRKVEGVALDPGGKAGWMLTDPDDTARPSELCRVEFDLEA